VLLAVVISAGNAASRYLFSESSNGWLEIQWYMFAGMVLLGAPYTLKMNEHVRVDLVYGMVSERTQIGSTLSAAFCSPAICIILIYFTWPWFVDSWLQMSSHQNAGGLVPKLDDQARFAGFGFCLMAIQGVSEIIKRSPRLSTSSISNSNTKNPYNDVHPETICLPNVSAACFFMLVGYPAAFCLAATGLFFAL